MQNELTPACNGHLQAPASSDPNPEDTLESARRLLPLMYEELRRLAAFYLRSERPDHTLQPTALVHEVFIKLMEPERVASQVVDRKHFFAIASQTIRRVLLDHARWKLRHKRTVPMTAFPIEHRPADMPQEIDVLALDDALNTLEQIHTRAAKVVELRYFGGLCSEEIASLLDISRRTVDRDWRIAQAWLYQELTGRPYPEGPVNGIRPVD